MPSECLMCPQCHECQYDNVNDSTLYFIDDEIYEQLKQNPKKFKVSLKDSYKIKVYSQCFFCLCDLGIFKYNDKLIFKKSGIKLIKYYEIKEYEEKDFEKTDENEDYEINQYDDLNEWS